MSSENNKITNCKLKKYPLYGSLFLFTIIGLYLFKALIFFNHTLFFRDFYRNVFPAKILSLILMKEQGLFAWNPYLDGGLPLLADISTSWILYPGNLLFHLLDPVSAFNWLTLIHFVWSGLGAYCLGKLIFRSSYSATVCSLAWIMSGLYLSSIDRPGYFFTVSWMPWVVWAWQRINESKLQNILCLAIVSLMQFLASEVQVAILSQVTGFIVCISRSQKRLISFNSFKNLTVAGIIALGLGAVQILPAYELSTLSTRGVGIPFERMTVNSLHPYQLMTFLLPYPFPLFPSEAGFQGYREIFNSAGIPLFVSLHTGALIFSIAIISLVKNRSREQLIWFAAMLAFLLLSFGKYLPYYFQVVHHFVPFGSSFIFPIKYFLPCQLFLCLLAGSFFDKQETPEKKHVEEILLFAIASFVLIVGFLVIPVFLNQFKSNLGDAAYDQIINNIHQQSLLTTFFIIGFAAISMFKSLPWRKNLLLSLIIIELLFYSSRIIWTTDRNFFSSHPTFPGLLKFGSKNILPPFRIEAYKMETPPSMIQIPGVEGLVERRRWKFQGMVPNAGTMRGLAFTFKYGPQRLQATYQLWTSLGLSPLDVYRLYGTRFYITSQFVKHKSNHFLNDKKMILQESSHGMSLYEDKGARPMAWLTSRWQPAKADLRISSLDDPVPIYSQQDLPAPMSKSGKNEIWSPVTKISSSSDGYTISVVTDSPSFLIISENTYPGWSAKLDGKIAEIATAYDVFKAVYIPPGQHEVEFQFKPKTLIIGATITIVSLFLVCGYMFRRTAVRLIVG